MDQKEILKLLSEKNPSRPTPVWRMVASPEVLTNILILMGYTLVFTPLGLLAFRWGYNRVRTEGTTASY